MNVLFLGSDELFARVKRQVAGQAWEVSRAEDSEQLLDFQGTHTFQAALIGLCEKSGEVRIAAQNARAALDVPVVIGLASQEQAASHTEWSKIGPDIIIPECGNDHLTKLQCDTILRMANGATSETVICGGVAFDISKGTFSVDGNDICLPYKKHKLLELLFLKRGRTVTKDMVFNHLYGWDEPPEAKIVDVFVCQIRRTLREAGLKQDCIQTVWGQGYRVTDSESFEHRRAA